MIEGSELSLVSKPFGSKCERIGMAPAKGLESNAKAELKFSSK